MGTGRKSQVEKFNRKWSKQAQDEQVIRETQAKKEASKTIMDKGEDVMKKNGGNPEDVFMVIARDSVELFTNMFDVKKDVEQGVAGLSDSIKEMVRNEVRSVVREELEIAVRGVFKGIAQGLGASNTQGKVEEVQHPTPVEPVEFELGVGSSLDELYNKYNTSTGVTEDTEEVGIMVEPNTYELDKDTTLETAIALAEMQGVDPTKGKEFKALGGRYSTLYQRFMKENKGVRGAWKTKVIEVLGQ